MNLIVTNPIIMILKAILNYFRIRRNYIADVWDEIDKEVNSLNADQKSYACRR